jgi:hypothetical protein
VHFAVKVSVQRIAREHDMPGRQVHRGGDAPGGNLMAKQVGVEKVGAPMKNAPDWLKSPYGVERAKC